MRSESLLPFFNIRVDLLVEEGQEENGDDALHKELAPVDVPVVVGVHAKGGVVDPDVSHVERVRVVDEGGLEEFGGVEDESGEDDGDDEAEDAPLCGRGVVHGAVVVDRVVDGNVAFEGDGDGHEDGARERDGAHGVQEDGEEANVEIGGEMKARSKKFL